MSLLNARSKKRENISDGTFEFDAPRFMDFTKPKFHKRKLLLDHVVLPPNQRPSCSTIDYFTIESLTSG